MEPKFNNLVLQCGECGYHLIHDKEDDSFNCPNQVCENYNIHFIMNVNFISVEKATISQTVESTIIPQTKVSTASVVSID